MIEAFPVAAPESTACAARDDIAERIRTHDWHGTALGPRALWPATLEAAVTIALASAQPMCVWWGPDLANIHNDACAELLGRAHAGMIAVPAAQAWAACWAQLAGPLRAVILGDATNGAVTVAWVIERQGRLEEAHHEARLTPLRGAGGKIEGVLCAFTDVTARVISERRLALFHGVAERTAGVGTLAQACERAAAALALGAEDIPFAALYVVDEGQRSARRVALAGIAPDHRAVPALCAVRGEAAAWPFDEALARPLEPCTVPLPESRYGVLPRATWSRQPHKAAVVALQPSPRTSESVVLIAALNPFRADDGGRFLALVTAHIAAGMANAQACSDERRRLEAETLQEVARDIASELDLVQLAQKITDAATRLTGARHGAFFECDPGAKSYRVRAMSGADIAAFAALPTPRATRLFLPVFLGQGPLRLDDVTGDARFGRTAPHQGLPAGHPPVRSFLAVPVISRSGDVLGGLFFGHPDAGVFDEGAERNAAGIAAQAAIAIDNANLYEQARQEIGRRARMEEDLRESERRSRELLAALPAAVYTTDVEGRIEQYNDAAVTLWGGAPESRADKWFGSTNLYTPRGEALALEQCPMAAVLRGEPVAGGTEIVIERPDGSLRHVLAHPRALRDHAGRVTGAVNMLVDITERKAAEAELASTKDQLALQVESLQRLHDLAMHLGGMAELEPALDAILATAVEAQGARVGLVWLHDPRTDELMVEARHGFDDTASELFTRVPPGPAGGGAGNVFARGARWVVADTETDPSFEPFRAAARAVGIRALHSTPIVTRSGALLGVLSVHYPAPRQPRQHEMQLADVCARHAADAIEAFRNQEMMRESERLYRAIGESIDYGVWICDPQGGNVYQSESMLKLVGHTADQHHGSGWLDVVHPDDREPCRAAWEECIRTGGQFDREHRVRGVDGAWHPILSRGVPVRNARGEITAWAGIALDIAKLKKVENDLRELDQRKNEFLATLAHELRNPLAPLRNGLEVMRLASGSAATVEKARGMMERQLAQMVRLVDDLLDVSRVSRGKIELRRADIELAAVLRNALETSQPLMAERGHRLVAALPPERIVVHGDMTRLAQVFWNLLNNAAKYTEPGGRIELGVRCLDGEVAVTVKDNGIGIPPDMQARVFDIFTQVERSLDKAQGGLGIGLSIAKRLVEMHGGTVEVHSAGHGQGSEFTVRLPARIAAPVEEGHAAARAQRAGMQRHRILVADDNPDSVATLSIMLEVMGHEVHVAHDGEEAAELAERTRPDAILLDIGMPRLNGYEACVRIRSQAWASGAFIVALTGWGQEEDKSRSRAAGFDRHLVKPVEPEMLQKLIEALPAPR